MNNSKSTYCLIVILLGVLYSTDSVFSQIPYDEVYRGEAIRNQEYITLFTDRNMYVVNERIYFRSFYWKDRVSAKELWSKVLYVELVTASGKMITNGKFYQDKNGSSGFLTIPADALTGNYYLRSYTRWMRNFGPRSYCYIPLTIINPYKQDVLTPNNQSPDVEANLLRMIFPGVQCMTDKESYAPGEEVQIEISRTGSDYLLPDDYCLTVVPAGLCDTLNAHINNNDTDRGKDFSFKYLPDIGGVSISGSVINAKDQSPAPKARLLVSTLEDQFDCLCTLSDELGRFKLTLPDRTGIQELFVACEPLTGTTREIRIDQDFATDPVPFRTKQFSLSTDDKKVAIRMVNNMRLSKAFKLEVVSPVSETETDSIVPFYGIPETTVNLEEFVDLPNMEEVFINLVPNVYVSYRRGEPSLTIYSLFKSISLFPPLFLVDQIPVFEQKEIFSIDPSKVERIEVVNEVYVKGGLMHGGIIIISSKQKDMAAVDLPEESYFFDYQAFHPGNSKALSSGSQPSPSSTDISTERIPDTRNTQLWVDKISLDSEEKKTLQFQASTSLGTYHILIRSVTSLGDIVCGVSTFKVEQK